MELEGDIVVLGSGQRSEVRAPGFCQPPVECTEDPGEGDQGFRLVWGGSLANPGLAKYGEGGERGFGLDQRKNFLRPETLEQWFLATPPHKHL